MKEEIPLPRWKYFILSIILGSIFNILLLIVVLNSFGFSGRSLISLFFISISGYFYKAIFFFLPFLYLNTNFSSRDELQKGLILYSPFLLYLLWFVSIILFQI